MTAVVDEASVIESSRVTEVFISYFHQAITSLAPVDSLQDEPQILGNTKINVFSRGLSAGMQTLMGEIVQNIRWFRDEEQSSALRVGKMRADAERIRAQIDNTDPWHNNLTIQDIQKNVSEVVRVYGKEGMERLSQLQEKIVKFHQEVIVPAKEEINANLIEQDRKVKHEEAKQVGYKSVEVPIGEPADLVTYSVSIGMAILRPFVKVFFHKKAQASRDRVTSMQMEAQINKEKLRVIEAHDKRLHVSEGALVECSFAFAAVNDALFSSVNEHAITMVTAQRTQPESEVTSEFKKDLNIMCSHLKNCMDSHRDFDAQVDELLDSLASLEHGPIKNRATIRVEEFYHMTKDVSSDIGSLLSIEGLIHEDRQHEFVTNICKIAEETAEMLRKIKDVFSLWARHTKLCAGKPVSHSVRKEAAGVIQDLLPFDREIRERIDNLEKNLHKKHAKSCSKRLQRLQKDGDRVHKGATWEGRSLATTAEASEIVQKLKDMASAVSKLSNEIMLPLTLGSGDEADGSNLDRLGEEVSLSVPESTLTMMSAALSTEIITLKNLARKRMVLIPRDAK